MAQPATARDLMAEWDEISEMAHQYLAVEVIHHMIQHDPERFAQYLDEAVAVTK